MNQLAMLQNYLIVGGLLFGLGAVGFLSRRNMIVMFLSAEMMLQGVSLSLVAWSGYHADWGGQMLTVFMIAVAACEAAIGLALVLMLHHRRDTLDIAFWQELREPGQPPHVDRELPEDVEPPRRWPRLTPAGVDPKWDREEVTHRSRV